MPRKIQRPQCFTGPKSAMAAAADNEPTPRGAQRKHKPRRVAKNVALKSSSMRGKITPSDQTNSRPSRSEDKEMVFHPPPSGILMRRSLRAPSMASQEHASTA